VIAIFRGWFGVKKLLRKKKQIEENEVRVVIPEEKFLVGD